MTEGASLGSFKTTETEPWQVHVFQSNKSVRFKMDTGTDVAVIPESCVLKRKTPLQKSTQVLFGPGQNSLNVLGKFSSKMESCGAVTIQDIYIVKNQLELLLDRPAIKTLHLIQCVETVQSTSNSY